MSGQYETIQKPKFSKDNGTAYVILSDIPFVERTDFVVWLAGKEMPVIHSEGESALDCAYYHDYIAFRSDYANAQTLGLA